MLAIATTMLVAGVSAETTEPTECKEDSFMDSCLSKFIDADGCDKITDAISGGEPDFEAIGAEILASGDIDATCFLCDDIGVIIGQTCQDPDECQEESFMNSCLSQIIEADVCDMALSGLDTEEIGMELLASGDVDPVCFLCDDIGDKIVEECGLVVSPDECQEESFIDSCMSQLSDAVGCDKALEMKALGNETASEEFAMEILASGDIDVSCFVCEDIPESFAEKCEDDQLITGAIVAMKGVNVGMIVGIIFGVLALISCIVCVICLCPICCVAAATVKATGDQRV